MPFLQPRGTVSERVKLKHDNIYPFPTTMIKPIVQLEQFEWSRLEVNTKLQKLKIHIPGFPSSQILLKSPPHPLLITSLPVLH